MLEPRGCAPYNIPGKAPISSSPTASVTPPPSQQSSVFVCVCVEGLDSVYMKCVFLLNTCTWFIPHVSAETRERNLVNKLDFMKKKVLDSNSELCLVHLQGDLSFFSRE